MDMTRHCVYCAKEFDIKPKKGDRISHGICGRHYIEELKENDLLSVANILAPIERPMEFCADMSQVFDG